MYEDARYSIRFNRKKLKNQPTNRPQTSIVHSSGSG